VGEPEAALQLYPVDGFEHLRFINVEGELQEANGERWFGLLRGAVEQRAEGIAVDLRGCRSLDDHCLDKLVAAAATLKARGGTGVAVVTLPGSALARRLRRLAADELAICDSTQAALTELGERRLPVPPLLAVEQDGDVAVIAINGEFDLAGEAAFRTAMDAALAFETPVVVDLEHCSFLDSTGIAMLLRAFRLAADRGFGLAASGRQVHRVLDLVGIPEHLPTFNTRRDAIAALLA
jgi:anti-anti-sigma factor